MAKNKDLLMSASTAQAPAVEVKPRLKPSRSADAARRFAIDCARILQDDKCEDIVVFDLRGVSQVCDYFVIGNGTSDRQMRAVAEHIEEMARGIGEKPYGVSGYDEGTWIVIDYVDVIIHLFDEQQREYYDLDSLWGDSPAVEWQR